MAHIGVLQWMEENRIPVDYVAGTSMGALVGSMYATGMSPAEMRRWVEDVNWDQALLAEPSYDELAFRRKQDRLNYQVAIPLGLKHGLEGPNGFNPGQGVGLLLSRIAFPYSTVSSFDELPIPFRCVATDMLTPRGLAGVLPRRCKETRTPMATRRPQIIETPTEARQAEPGPSVLALLAVSTGLAMLVLGVVWFVFFRT